MKFMNFRQKYFGSVVLGHLVYLRICISVKKESVVKKEKMFSSFLTQCCLFLKLQNTINMVRKQ